MLTDSLHALAESPAFVAGWILIAALVLQVFLQLGSSLRRLIHDRRRLRLEEERLKLDIQAAQLRVEGVEQGRLAWNGIRKFTVAKKEPEGADTFSFYLKPHDGKPLPGFRPGQYLTFQLNIPGLGKPLVRCYSLSDCARPWQYRVTIKRCTPPPNTAHPPGLSSTYFCDVVKQGDILDVKAPSGHFFLDLERRRPVVLISAGVGITPMISMVNAITEAESLREVWFFFGTRNSQEHLFKSALAELTARHPNVHCVVCYSKPLPDDVRGRDYHHEGRVNVPLLKQLLPSNNYEYYLCGPGPFMENITYDLRSWGVPDEWVHFEAFGPSTVKRAAKPEIKAALAQPAQGTIEIQFSRSGRTAAWTGQHASILECAEAFGIRMESGCRAGNCGACLVAIKSGDVDYIGHHGSEPEAGSCLACICKPRNRLILDA